MTQDYYSNIKIADQIKNISYLEDQLKINKILNKISDKTIVTTSGCFDLLHNGHLYSFYEAKRLADILIVGLNSDVSIRQIKGNSRPIRSEIDRASMLSSIKYIDYVVIFNEKTPEEFLRKIKPNIHCKGGDYKNPKDLFEYNLVKKLGGEIKILKFIEGNSTTKEIEKISRL